MHYEGNCIRPPPEADSILVQVTLGCSHNKCAFCGTYKDKRFRIKDDDIILSDILFASKYMRRQDRVFLMDGDALIIPQKRLMWILERIREHLPWVKRVGSYANTRSIGSKSPRELIELREKGLGMLYLGVETGHDETRKKIHKGSSAQHCLEMGKRVKNAGMQLTVTLLLGIAGKENSLDHARATGELISMMDPDYASALTVILIPGTPLWEEHERGDFEMPDERGLLMEMKEMLARTHLSCGLFSSTHASNYLSVRAWLPEGKQELLDSIDAALQGEIRLKPEWMRSF
ncbi:MAG: B12-binding domain-containing radical SAM protein [Deltaproteobacteria bacterium]|nr:MAG: B12-binding domain-containing radical SAM protein [Deltaproteobacteria bacterium]